LRREGYEAAKAETSEIKPEALSLTDQQKLKVVIDQHKKKLDAQFKEEVARGKAGALRAPLANLTFTLTIDH
jgi:hypothetical protein